MTRTIAAIKSVHEYLADCITAFKGTKSAAAMVETLPWWSEDLAQVAGQAVPGIGVILKYYEKHTFGTEAYEVGLKVCTMAMQRAMAEAVDQLGPPKESANLAGADAVAQKLRNAEVTPPDDLDGFNWLDWRTHPFTKRALDDFAATACALGYRDREPDRLRAAVMMRFPHHLNTLLTNRSLAARFKPFADYLNNVDEGTRVRLALQQHAQLMARIYHDQPLFGQEAFSLSQIYLHTECGSLTWGDINPTRQNKGPGRERQAQRIDPFNEKHGGRHDTLKTIMNLITDPDYDEPIVIQGTAGSGKSSLTLHLCDHLLSLNLVPILIRLRDLPLHPGTATTDALKEAIAVRFGKKEYGLEVPPPPHVDDLFDQKRIWHDHASLEGTDLCRYVLILDGWDELSVSEENSFSQRAQRLLHDVRREFMDQSLPIRLIVTGRPSRAIAETGFLKQKTRILTLRPLKPNQVDSMVAGLTEALKLQRFKSEAALHWQIDENKVEPLLATYRKSWLKEGGDRELEIINSPLLAFLAVRLVHETPYDPETLVENPTLLYRELVNLTCSKGGQPQQNTYDPDKGTRYAGEALRRLLQHTAVAMFIRDQDNLSFQELDHRLHLLGAWNKEDDSLIQQIGKSKHACPLMDLMISYFFKGGNEQLGCEFTHKSFREYLYAEALLSRLNAFGRDTRSWRKAAEGGAFWDEPADSNPLSELAEDLVRFVAAHRFSPEIHRHVFSLLETTIREDLATADDFADWCRIRDGMAEVWAWWTAAIPQRNVPHFDRRKRHYHYEPSLFAEMSEELLPVDSAGKRPTSIGSMDAHCGEVFWQLNSVIHFEIARANQWLASEFLWENAQGSASSEYQVTIPNPNHQPWILFAPGGVPSRLDPNRNRVSWVAICRINASEERGMKPFPVGAILKGNYLANSVLAGINATKGKMSAANFSNSILKGARLEGAALDHANLDRAALDGAALDRANLYHANLDGARLDGAGLGHASLYRAKLRGARLDGARLDRAALNDARLDRASLDRASLYRTSLCGARLDGTSLDGANLERAVLDGAQLNRAGLNRASLVEASLVAANLFSTEINHSDFSYARLASSTWKGAKLKKVIFTGTKISKGMLSEATCNDLIDGPKEDGQDESPSRDRSSTSI